MCELPNAGMNMEVKYITGTMDAEVTCYDGVIEPGTIPFTINLFFFAGIILNILGYSIWFG